MSGSNVTHKSSSWKALLGELKRRTLEPLGHPSFVIYFVVAVVIIGGIGLWLELYKYIFFATSSGEKDPVSPLRTAVITFFPALAGTACLQIVWAEHQKAIRSFGILFLCLMTVTALAISPSAIGNHAALIIGGFSSVAALWTWWVANANQKELLDSIDSDAPLGKKNAAAPLSGNLENFVV